MLYITYWLWKSNNDAELEGGNIGIFYGSTLYLDEESIYEGETDGVYIEEESNLISQ